MEALTKRADMPQRIINDQGNDNDQGNNEVLYGLAVGPNRKLWYIRGLYCSKP